MTRLYGILCFSGALLLTAPGFSQAHMTNQSLGAERLEEQLRPGRPPTAYRRQLRDMGYAIAVNGNTPDYTEYDISRGDEAYRVKIAVDQDTGRATRIDVVPSSSRHPRAASSRWNRE
jgi:hypothetical protein